MAHLAEAAPGHPNDGSGALRIDDSDGLGSTGKMEGVALIDGNGDVVQFVSFEGNSITAKHGPAKGATRPAVRAPDLALHAALEHFPPSQTATGRRRTRITRWPTCRSHPNQTAGPRITAPRRYRVPA